MLSGGWKAVGGESGGWWEWWVGGVDTSQGARDNYLREMLQQRPAVLLKPGEKGRNLEVSVRPAADREVVGASHDVYAVREVALTANVLLERGGGGAAAVDFTVKDDHHEERLRWRWSGGGWRAMGGRQA